MSSLTRKRKASQIDSTLPTSRTSSMAVFQITELLEQILSDLSWKDLYTSKRVCRRFNEVITDSMPLRQKTTLFLPEPDIPLSDDEPLRRISDEKLSILMVTGMIGNLSRNTFGLAEGQRISPLLEPWQPYYNWRASNGPQPTSAPFTFEIASGQAWRTPGSWRQMYLTDPPVKQVKVRLWWGIEDAGFCSFCGCIQDDDGITFGKLLDLVLQSTQPCSFTGCTHQIGEASKEIRDVPGDTPAETIRRLEERLGGKAELSGEKSYVMFSCVPQKVEITIARPGYTV